MAVPPRSRLGRGLGALLSASPVPPPVLDTRHEASATASSPSDVLRNLNLDQIDVNPNQPRRTFDDATLDELAASIKANGIIQPIVVRPVGDRYELVAGERRHRAARKAGLTLLPAIIRDVDAYTQAQWALVENIHRQDLNALERAEAYATLMSQLGLTQAELAGRLGEQRSSIANHLRLLELGEFARAAVRAGQLTMGHAKVLAGLPWGDVQTALATACAQEQWSVRDLERHVAAAIADAVPDVPQASPTPPVQAHFGELEAKLAQHLGLRVDLRRGKKQGTGQIVLHYTTLDQFDDLVRRWGVTFDGR